MEAARFQFNTRLLDTLAGLYKSSEDALKELVANCWDADATLVRITLPRPLSNDPLVIEDNGLGMTLDQIRTQYLNIGYDRRASSGETTPRSRVVRGSRGIGKLAGLQLAAKMTISTTSFRRKCTFTLSREDFERHSGSLDSVDIPIEVADIDGVTGTMVMLEHLRSNISFPDAGKLKLVLLREFGVRDDFAIEIDGTKLSMELLPGTQEPLTIQTSSGATVEGRLWITTRARAVPETGITIRVDGRAIGNPTFFGVESDRDIPSSILHRLVGEVNASHLRDVTLPTWDAFNTSSVEYQEFEESCRAWLRDRAIRLRDELLGSAPTEFVEQYRQQIERLPIPRRELARAALLRVFNRLFDEPMDKKHTVAELVLDTFERDDYWLLVQRIQEASSSDIQELASILEEWGFYEINGVVIQARRRITFIDQFESLIRDPGTLELSGVHRALKNNLWLLGESYELLKSNVTLERVIEDVFGKQYTGSRARERPDLFLAALGEQYVLVELKRPSQVVGRDEVAQAEKYRDEILPHLPNGRIEVIVIGGRANAGLLRNPNPAVKVMSYLEVVLQARHRCEWLTSHLSTGDSEGVPLAS